MTILTEFGKLHISFEIRQYFSKKSLSNSFPSLCTKKLSTKSTFRPSPSYFHINGQGFSMTHPSKNDAVLTNDLHRPSQILLRFFNFRKDVEAAIL